MTLDGKSESFFIYLFLIFDYGVVLILILLVCGGFFCFVLFW